MNRIGGLWQKEKEGRVYLSGQIDLDGKKINILIFPNDRKEQENHPDFNIMAKDGMPAERSSPRPSGGFPKRPYASSTDAKPDAGKARPNWKDKTNIFNK